MKHLILFVTLLFFATIIIGCGQRKTPSDLPKLYSCTVTFTQDGKPLADAAVEFIPAEAAKYLPAAFTDADGKAVMKTYGEPGVPVGRYKITVTKIAETDIVVTKAPSGMGESKTSKKFQTVEPQYSDAKTTPLELEITGKEKNVTKTFDTGKEVKIQMTGIGF